MRPLRDIERTAEAIAAGDLGRRVPERDPRTEVGKLGRSLNVMLAHIEAAFRARTASEEAARRSEEAARRSALDASRSEDRMRQFVADASHELRTPLTAIRGFAEYYRQRGGVARPPRLARARSSGGRRLRRRSPQPPVRPATVSPPDSATARDRRPAADSPAGPMNHGRTGPADRARRERSGADGRAGRGHAAAGPPRPAATAGLPHRRPARHRRRCPARRQGDRAQADDQPDRRALQTHRS